MGIQKSASSTKSKLEQCKQRQFSQDNHAQLAKRDRENCFIAVTIVTSSLPYMMASLNDRKQTNILLSFLVSFKISEFIFYCHYVNWVIFNVD